MTFQQKEGETVVMDNKDTWAMAGVTFCASVVGGTYFQPVRSVGLISPLGAGWDLFRAPVLQIFLNKMTKILPNAARTVWITLFVQNPMCASLLANVGPFGLRFWAQNCVS